METMREMGLLFHLLVHSFVDSCVFALTGDRTHNLGISNLVTQQGYLAIFLQAILLLCASWQDIFPKRGAQFQ